MTAALQGPLGRIALESPRITVGRAQDNQLVVSDPKASAHHAVIQLHGESYTVTDLGSTNGTFVNEQKLDRNIPQFLKSSDKVRIGDTVFIYEYEHPAPSLEDTAIDTNLKSGYEATVKAPPSYVPPGKPLENMPPNPFEPEPPSRPSSPSYPAYGAPEANPTPPSIQQPSAPATPSNPAFPPVQQPSNQPSYPSYGTQDADQSFPTLEQVHQEFAPPASSQPTDSYARGAQSSSSPSNPSYPPVAPTSFAGPSNPSAGSTSYAGSSASPSPYSGLHEQFGNVPQQNQSWTANNNTYSSPTPAATPPNQSWTTNDYGSPTSAAAPPNQSWATNDPYGAPTSAVIPPPYAPHTQQPPQKKNSRMTMIIIAVVVVLVVGVGGGVLYFATRPQPVITVTSDYKVGTTFAGATDTSLKVSGQNFSHNSAITFLLDDKPAPGVQPLQSDDQGNVTGTLKITGDWTVGDHTLTAKDASDYKTKAGLSLKIVQQGDAHTPGPNGAPPNDAKGTIAATISTSSGRTDTETLQLNTSTSSPVCRDKDDGQPHTSNGTTNDGTTFRLTLTSTCTGSYKAGKLTYVENVSSGSLVYSDGLNCTMRTPFENEHLEGTFSNSTTLNGTYSADSVTLDCTKGGKTQALRIDSETGTWTGVAAVS